MRYDGCISSSRIIGVSSFAQVLKEQKLYELKGPSFTKALVNWRSSAMLWAVRLEVAAHGSICVFWEWCSDFASKT